MFGELLFNAQGEDVVAGIRTPIHLSELNEQQPKLYKELEDIGRFTNLGGNVRAMIGGGWGFASFNDVNRLSHYVELAINQARLIGRRDSRLAEAEPVSRCLI